MRRALLGLATAVALLLGLAGSAVAEPSEGRWQISSLAVPTHFAPGGKGFYEVRVTNIGAAPADGTPLTIVDTLPAGLTVERVELPLREGGLLVDKGATQCSSALNGDTETVTCTVPSLLPGSEPARLGPEESIRMIVYVEVPADASGTLLNEVEVQGGGIAATTATSENEATSAPVPQGLAEFSAQARGRDGLPLTGAATHPYAYVTTFAANSTTPPPGSNLKIVPAGGDIKDVEVALPPGLAGNPLAVPRCTARQFNTFTRTDAHAENECPDASAVGLVLLRQVEGNGSVIGVPLYNLVPDQLGFTVSTLPFYIDTELRSGSDYGVTARVRNNSQAKRVVSASVVIWGNPADPSHDPLRGHCANNGLEGQPLTLGDCDAEGVAERPFLRLPTNCESPMAAFMSFNVWPDPQSFAGASSTSPAPTGCEAVSFDPGFAATPDQSAGDSPAGMVAHVHIPQSEDPDEPASADLRKTVVTLPEGLVVNPAGADGLAACTPAQVGLTSAVGAAPATFTPAPAACPEAAKIGTVEVRTPVLDHPLHGGVYVAAPHENPFGTLLALYIAVADPQTGVVLKLPGRVDPDPKTGQITATFDETPQQPFEDFELRFFGGPAASLRTPAVCGTHTAAAQMTPWSAPASGPPAERQSSFEIASSCAASAAELPHRPTLRAGTTDPRAGAFSPLVVDLSRADGSQELSGLSLTAPDGLTGKLAGIPYCPEDALAAAAARSGRAELAGPSCPEASRLGSVAVGAGAGPAPYFTSGQIYLAPPYKGAPASMAIITPAVAGPFDLGTVVVRTALRLDPETARITAVSDPIPEILEGIPLDVRRVAVRLDRPGFILNPTDCSELSFTGTATSTQGEGAELKDGFQASGCRRLGFGPELSIKLY